MHSYWASNLLGCGVDILMSNTQLDSPFYKILDLFFAEDLRFLRRAKWKKHLLHQHYGKTIMERCFSRRAPDGIPSF